MGARIAFAAAGVALGLLLAAGISLSSRETASRESPAPAEAPRAGAPERVDPAAEPRTSTALAEALQAEVEARRELADEVEWLREEVAQLRADLDVEERRSRELAEQPVEDPAQSGNGERQEFFDRDALLEHGVGHQQAARLEEAYEQMELERLYLGDRAAREGWLFKPRHRMAHQGVERRLREELGDEAYDQMLYGAGRNNRVLVGDVLAGSPAERAGLEPGDVLLEYGDRRVFRPQELRRATTQGESGESTPISVLRDGRVVRLEVPRGPLGVRAVPKREPPVR